MFNRREFLRSTAAGISFVSLSGGVPCLLTRASAASAKADLNDHVLLVVELAGGNDGLNTLVPFEDPLYYKNRPTLAMAKEQLVKLSDQAGLHPQLAPLGELFREGKLAVVQGVGYPEPDRSHFRSQEIWHTASTEKRAPAAGWLGRLLDATTPVDGEGLTGLTMTPSLPQALRAERVVVPVVSQLESLSCTGDDASPKARLLRKLGTADGASEGPVPFIRQQARAVYRAAERLKEAAAKNESNAKYPETALAHQLRQAAQIVAADLGVRVLYALHDGYDTHAGQAGTHPELLGELANSLAAFQRDLAARDVSHKVVVLVFSEFGRRVDENASQGTDHGAASCLFVVGAPVAGGLFGEYPSLEQLGDGDLIFNTDFRSVYATLLADWLGAPAKEVLGGEFPGLDLIQKPA